jgi:hypothetical protein
VRDHEARVGGIVIGGPPVIDKIRRGCGWKRRFTFERTGTMRVSVGGAVARVDESGGRNPEGDGGKGGENGGSAMHEAKAKAGPMSKEHFITNNRPYK